jgi:uncharacterized membrane protein YhaH (DUF805 family)
MFSGRLDRLGFLIGTAYYLLLYVLLLAGYVFLSQLVGNLGESDNVTDKFVHPVLTVVGYLLICLFAVLQVSIAIRRWHDMDQTGWLVLLSLIPIVNLIAAIFLLFVSGTSGANQYGAPNSSRGFKTVLFGKGSSGVVAPD